MKKIFAVILAVLLFALLSCAALPTLFLFDSIASQDKVLNSLGEYQSHEFYTQGAFQDFTDYAKYYYDSVDFIDNEYFVKIQVSDIDNLNNHLDDFEKCIELFHHDMDVAPEIAVKYDFDRSLIDCEDYLYIETEWFEPYNDGNLVFASYDIYFFNVQTNTLYYFHNNI